MPYEDTKEAIDYLYQHGYKLSPKFHWSHPDNKEPTDKEVKAMRYLTDEWDFGYYQRSKND